MKLKKRTSIQGNFAKKDEDIKHNDVIKILDGGKEVEGDYGKRYVFKINTRNGERLLTFNQTTINNLIDVYGDETSNWVGKEAKVWIIKMNVGGKIKDVVYLSHPEWVLTSDGFVPPQDSIPVVEEDKVDTDNIPF